MLKNLNKFNTPLRGALIGSIFGLIFSVGYIASSIWLCSGLLSCPAHWFPFFLIGIFIFISTVIFTMLISIILKKMYHFFDVSGTKN